jgi:GntR family transcriptional regulator, transcriptional repressor for pyruvate dehydrogenase complex
MMVSVPAQEHVGGGVSRALALHNVTALHVWEGLSVLEPPIAALAARRRSAQDLQAIEESAAEFTRPGAERSHAVRSAAEFFRRLAAAAHNPVLTLAQEPLLQLLEPSLGEMIDRVPQARTRIATAHTRLLAALGARDAEAAQSWMGKHVRDFRRGYELAGISLTAAMPPAVATHRAAVAE